MKHRGKKARRTGKFRDDARVYLDAVKAMPTYAERVKHIEEWIAEFGDRERDSITAVTRFAPCCIAGAPNRAR
jgi:hypothetical protein